MQTRFTENMLEIRDFGYRDGPEGSLKLIGIKIREN